MAQFELIKCKDRDEWLKLRHGVVSSTESAALFGMSPYMTPLELAVGKQQTEPTQFEQNERMKWGTRLQDSIAMGIQDDYGVHVQSLGNQFSKRTDLRMGASFDFLIRNELVEESIADERLLRWFRRFGPGLLEIKNVDSLQFKNEWVDGEAPDHIEIQLQHQLQCTDYKWGVIAALVGGNRIELVVRQRDEKAGEGIRNKIAAFWMDLERGKLPDPVWPQDAAFIAGLYTNVTEGKTLNVSPGNTEHDPDVIKWCDEYRQAHASLTLAEEVKSTRKAMILQRIQDAHKVIAGPYRISAGNVDACHIEYDRSAYRDFRITQPKVKSGENRK